MKSKLFNLTLYALAFLVNETDAATSTAASIGLNENVIDSSLVSADSKTVKYQPFVMDLKDDEKEGPIYQPCTCDLTSNTCDPFCCCDPDCPTV